MTGTDHQSTDLRQLAEAVRIACYKPRSKVMSAPPPMVYAMKAH
jgi:hypothetical protein